MTKMRQGALAAATLAVVALGVAGPAAAAAQYQPAHPRSCWHYSSHSEHWINVCRTYSARSVDPRYQPIYPGYGKIPYPYRYEPPLNSNGPYAGYAPYNGYESALGFSF